MAEATTASAPTPPSRRELHERLRDVLHEVPDTAAQARTLLWRMRLFCVLQVSELALLVWLPWGWMKVLLALTFAVYRARTAWTIIHNRVHAPPLPNWPSKLLYDFATGFVAIWWRAHHLQHHAHTNTPRDPDTRIFLGRDMTHVLGPQRPRWRRVLGWALTVVQFPIFFFLFLVRSLQTYNGNGLLFVFPLVLFGALLSFVLPPAEARLNSMSNLVVGTTYLFLTFAPTHSAVRDNFELTGNWVTDQVRSTNNVWPESAWYTWFVGGINTHIEHHLLPHVPSDQLHRLVPDVKAFASDHGLPYHRYSLVSIWWAHLRFLARF